jgi:hypothetical protein
MERSNFTQMCYLLLRPVAEILYSPSITSYFTLCFIYWVLRVFSKSRPDPHGKPQDRLTQKPKYPVARLFDSTYTDGCYRSPCNMTSCKVARVRDAQFLSYHNKVQIGTEFKSLSDDDLYSRILTPNMPNRILWLI